MGKNQLIVCGSIAIDRIMTFSGAYRELVQPEKIDSFSISVLIDEIKTSRGGTGANIAYNLAKLGEEPILVGSVGGDANEYIDDLKKLGVDTGHVNVSELQTASFNVINDSEDNQVGGFYPGAMADTKHLSISEWSKSGALVTVSAHDPNAMKRQVADCKKNALRLFYDVSQQVSNISKEDLLEGIDAAEIIIVNDYEMSLLCTKSGLSPNDIRSKVQIVITTHGSKGSIIEGTAVKIAQRIPIAEPKRVVDPTGAGDGYRAGFLYGYNRGWDLEECGRLGATIASFIVEGYGSQLDYTKDEVQERYLKNFGKGIKL